MTTTHRQNDKLVHKKEDACVDNEKNTYFEYLSENMRLTEIRQCLKRMSEQCQPQDLRLKKILALRTNRREKAM